MAQRLSESEQQVQSCYVTLVAKRKEKESKCLKLQRAFQRAEAELAQATQSMQRSLAFVDDVRQQSRFHKRYCVEEPHSVVPTQPWTHFFSVDVKQNLPVMGVHVLDSILDWGLWECTTSAKDETQVAAFLLAFFPILQWNQAEQVAEVAFIPQPCQAEVVNRSSNCSDGSGGDSDGGCNTPGCRYWHEDQLSHVRAAAVMGFFSIRHQLCTQESQQCLVSRSLLGVMDEVHSSSSLEECCGCLCRGVSRFIRLDWHLRTFIDGVVVRPSDLARPWAVPVQAATALSPVNYVASYFSVLLRDASEMRLWEYLQRGSGSRSSIILRLFAMWPTALVWRALTFFYCSQRRQDVQWMAAYGCKLFASSPHLYLLRVVSHLPDHKATRDAASRAVDTCLETAALLSEQCAASLFTKTGGAAFRAIAMRYVAYMVAATAVHLLEGRRSSSEGVRHDDAGAEASDEEDEGCLTEVLRLLQTATDPARLFLLPIALQNLSLMLVAVQQQGHLAGVSHLPLGAVSDLLFVLSPSNDVHQEVGVLNRQLQLHNRCEEDGLHPGLLEQLKSAAQVSLLRSRHVTAEVMETLMMKSSLSGATLQTSLCLEYVGRVEQSAGPRECKVAAAALAAGVEGQNQLAYLLLRWRCCDTVCQKDSQSGSEEGSELSCLEVAARAVLHACYCTDEPHHGLEYIQECMTAAPCRHDPLAVILLLVGLLKQAGRSSLSLSDFMNCLRVAVDVLLEQHLMWWSPLDSFYQQVIGLPHYAVWLAFYVLPAVLSGRPTESVAEWRRAVLTVGNQYACVHPLLRQGCE